MSKILLIHGYYEQDPDTDYGRVMTSIYNSLKNNGVERNEIELVNPFSFCQEQFNFNQHENPKDTAQWYRGLRTEQHNRLIRAQQEKITQADYLIFYFPIWWQAAPPLFMQWMSDVFRGASFKTVEGRPVATWGEQDIQAMILTTSGYTSEVKLENYDKVLSATDPAISELLTIEQKQKMMELAQAYPLITALSYAGIPVKAQAHINNVQHGDDVHLSQAISRTVNDLLRPTFAQAEKPILVSGGPHAIKTAPIKAEREIDSDTKIKVSQAFK